MSLIITTIAILFFPMIITTMAIAITTVASR
jgi:hypothetical protein